MMHRHIDFIQNISKQYKITKVKDSIIKFEKKINDNPYAVCFCDFTEMLPATSKALITYLDDIVGQYYFDGNKSLQWNNYLYFIVDEKEIEQERIINAKQLIESNRLYARKYVVTEKQLFSILFDNVSEDSTQSRNANVFSTWTNMLAQHGYDSAIFDENLSMPARLEAIENSIEPLEFTTKNINVTEDLPADNEHFLKSMEIIKFREYPIKKKFNFSNVNLIVGANGSGKTSLLEAIELIYCGKNKRDSNNRQQYHIIANYENQCSGIYTHERDFQEFRDKHLRWYGQHESKKTWNLFSSFAKYNFLNTDAAVHFVESSDDYEMNLSKLLIGPTASKVWTIINKVFEALNYKQKDYKKLKESLEQQIDELNKKIEAANEVRKISDSNFDNVISIFNKNNWECDFDDKNIFVDSFINKIEPYISCLNQMILKSRAKLPLTIKTYNDHFSDTKKMTSLLQKHIDDLVATSKNVENLKAEIHNNENANNCLLTMEKIFVSDVVNISEQHKQCENHILHISSLLSELDEKTFSSFSDSDLKLSLNEFINKAEKNWTSQINVLEKQKHYGEKIRNHKNIIDNYTFELKELAYKIIENSVNKDECPLCHTLFEKGKLFENIKNDFDMSLENDIQENILLINEQEKKVSIAKNCIDIAKPLVIFCEKNKTSKDESIHTIIMQIKEYMHLLNNYKDKAAEHLSSLNFYTNQGISAKQIGILINELKIYGYNEVNVNNIDELLSELEKNTHCCQKKMFMEEEKYNRILISCSDLLSKPITDMHSLIKIQHDFIVELSFMHDYIERLREIIRDFDWPENKPIEGLIIELEFLKSCAFEFKDAIYKEKHIYSDITAEKNDMKLKYIEISKKFCIYNNACSFFGDLITKHSLSDALQASLDENRKLIEKIFLHIHSPSEFSSLGNNISQLIKNNGNNVSLNQISTGQRAAFVLSIFLAQNLHLTSAPPIIIIDDVIAHIDDLNSLAFLDFLREVILSRKRQIFFATASSKMASLFERKFDFLGDKFTRIELSR